MAKHDRASIRDGRKPGWFYVDDALIDRYGPAVGAIGVAVYAALARHANANAQAAVGYDRLASSLAVSRNTIITKLRKLSDEGLITIEPQIDSAGNPIAANIYTLCIIPEHNGQCADGGVPTVAPPVPIIGTPHATIGQGVPTVAPPVPTVAPGGYQQLHAKESTIGGVGVGVGVGEPLFLRELIERELNPTTAQMIVQTYPDNLPAILQSLDNMLADGAVTKRSRDATIGQFVKRLKMTPPALGEPYPRMREVASITPSAPPVATRPNRPETPISPAELLQKRGRNAAS